MTDTDTLKPRLKEYIAKRGLNTLQDGTVLRVQCPDPSHADNNPSAVVYDECVYCPVCEASMDVFEVAGYVESVSSFPDKKQAVMDVLGVISNDPSPRQNKQTPKDAPKVVALTTEQARQRFNKTTLLDHGKRAGYGTHITGAWPYKNERGEVEIIDVRFEGGQRKKNVVTFYWNGSHVKSKGAPVKIYGRDKVAANPQGKILIVEGAKSAKAAETLEQFGFFAVTWNGGTAKILKADWSFIRGREVYFYPDDDRQKDKKTGSLLPPEKQPGIKAALALKTSAGGEHIKICQPFPSARSIKADGADIVEALEAMPPSEVAMMIDLCPKIGDPGKDTPKPKHELPPEDPADREPTDTDAMPFRVLGVAEDQRAYFIDRHERLYDFKLDGVSKNKLLQLASLTWWNTEMGVGRMRGEDWDTAQDLIIEIAGRKDFSLDNIRGRGAWTEPDGRLCFHDGAQTIGEYGDTRVFLRKPRIDIGLGSPDIEATQRDAIKKAVFALSFETQTDAMRLLSWSILAPFSGALSWRPQALLTGPSSSGKSSIESNIVKPLAIPSRYSGGDTTPAGILQDRKKDCGAVVIEEADPDTEKKKGYREELLSLMRQSTSDDTPKSAKGTSDQGGTSYIMRDCFFFVAISPDIESVADDNRLVKINTKQPSNDGPKWSELRKALNESITEEAGRRLRAMVWRNLEKIKDLAGSVADAIQDVTGKGHRFAISEGTLMAAYLVVWKGIAQPSADQIRAFVEANYDISQPEEERDETSEMINRLLEQRVRVVYDGHTYEFNAGEALTILQTGTIEGTGSDMDIDGRKVLNKDDIYQFRRAVNNVGLALDADGNLAIANNHSAIKTATGKSSGYSRILKRHPQLVDKDRNIKFTDGQRKCSVIAGIFEAKEIPF